MISSTRNCKSSAPARTELVADSHHGASCRHRVGVDEKQPELIAARRSRHDHHPTCGCSPRPPRTSPGRGRRRGSLSSTMTRARPSLCTRALMRSSTAGLAGRRQEGAHTGRGASARRRSTARLMADGVAESRRRRASRGRPPPPDGPARPRRSRAASSGRPSYLRATEKVVPARLASRSSCVWAMARRCASTAAGLDSSPSGLKGGVMRSSTMTRTGPAAAAVRTAGSIS